MGEALREHTTVKSLLACEDLRLEELSIGEVRSRTAQVNQEAATLTLSVNHGISHDLECILTALATAVVLVELALKLA